MLTVTGLRVGINTAAPLGTLDVRGDIQAGNSDLYFTKTDHDSHRLRQHAGLRRDRERHELDGALMILGRTVTTNPLHRASRCGTS